MNKIQLNDSISIKSYESGFSRIYGYLLYIFDAALYVQDGSKSCYVKLSDLIDRITQIDDRDASASLLSSSKSIQRIAKEILNPLLGRATSVEKIATLFNDVQTSEYISSIHEAQDDQTKLQLTEKKFTDLKSRNIALLPYDPQELQKRLKPGDIFFKKQDELNHHIVVLGQKIIQPLLSGIKEREAYKYSHVAIYLGEGKIAEAAPHDEGCEVRVLNLSDSRFALDKESKNSYLITRSTDAALAKEAAEIAGAVACEAGPNLARETPFKYTKLQALRSIWHSASFGPFARYRYLKQYIDDHRKQLPRDFIDLKSFFCSYFVGFAFQTAESRRIMPKLLGENDSPIKGITVFDTAVFRGLWARVRRIEFWRHMSELVQYKFDAKRMTPQDFRNFIVNHPDLFVDLFATSQDAPPLPIPEEKPTADALIEKESIQQEVPAAAKSACTRFSEALLYPASLVYKLAYSVVASARRAVA